MTVKNENIEDTFLAKWIADELSDTEFKQLVSEADYLAYQKIKEGINVYQHIETADNDFTLKQVKKKISSINTKKKSPKVISIYYKAAIAVAASFILLFGLNNFFFNDVTNSTNFGEQQTITLLDGSEVILNAKSTLTYNKKDWATNREVTLDGEGFFKVKKGSTFTVNATNGSITVLGTQFNVLNNSNFFETTCYQGKVSVVSDEQKFVLTPTMRVTNNNGIVTSTTIQPNQNPTWIDGISSFKAVPLKQVILALEKQFNISFKPYNIDDSVIFTGSFDNKNLKSALASVFETVQINYTVKNNIVTLERQP